MAPLRWRPGLLLVVVPFHAAHHSLLRYFVSFTCPNHLSASSCASGEHRLRISSVASVDYSAPVYFSYVYFMVCFLFSHVLLYDVYNAMFGQGNPHGSFP